MSTRFLLVLIFLCAAAQAYPPAPFHRIYGSVRDDHGNPLATGVGAIILSGSGNQEIIRGTSDTDIGIGINYSLSVPSDSGTTAQLYTVSALRPMLPFTIRVVIANVSYVPLQMVGATWTIGDPSLSTRLDLTLGIDSDNDGLPDQWEYDLIDSDLTGRLQTLADVNPNDDLDGDGLTNLQEYIAGTYALDVTDGLFLHILSVDNGLARLQFLAIKGRTYTISSSANLTTFLPQTFSTAPTGANPAMSFLSDDVRTVDAYVPIDVAAQKFYKLKAQ